MTIKTNGEEKSFSEATMTVADLLRRMAVETPDTVSVQLNGSFVERVAFTATVVKDRDEVDFLYFLGGGGR